VKETSNNNNSHFLGERKREREKEEYFTFGKSISFWISRIFFFLLLFKIKNLLGDTGHLVVVPAFIKKRHLEL
jgi:hypothetical protein